MKKKVLLLSMVLSSTMVIAQPSPTSVQKADEFFKSNSVISFNENIKPEQLVGVLLYYKAGKRDDFEYMPILTTEERKTIEPKYNQEIMFQTMANQATVSSVKYLSIFSASVKTNYLLEVILEDVLDYSAPSLFSNPEFQKRVFIYANMLKQQGFVVEYVDNVNLCTLTTRLFSEQNVAGSGSYFVDASNKTYAGKSEFTKKRLISLHGIAVSLLMQPQETQQINKLFDDNSFKKLTSKIGNKKSEYILADEIRIGSDKLFFKK